MKTNTNAETGTFARTRDVGRAAALRALEMADAALIEAGKAAERRQRRRAAQTALKVAGKAALAAGTLVAAAIAVNGARTKKPAA